MPVNLPHSMRFLDISFNHIALVQSPRNYEYCANCNMRLQNNPWICDRNMINMLIWSYQVQGPTYTITTGNDCQEKITKGKYKEF